MVVKRVLLIDTKDMVNDMSSFKNLFAVCCFGVVASLVACGGAVDGKNGSPGESIVGPPGSDAPPPVNGVDGRNGVDGKDGQNGEGIQGVPGPAGADGASVKGDQGERGSDGDAGLTLCGDTEFPNYHQSCGSDLVGSCASSNLRFECHIFMSEGETGDITQDFKIVCADSTTHAVVAVGAAQSSEYPNNPVAVSSGKCDEDADCDSVLDQTSTVLGDAESNQPTVHLGDVMTVASPGLVVKASMYCTTATVVCDAESHHLQLASSAPATHSDWLGTDCFDPATQRELTFSCSAGGVTIDPTVSPDNDGDANDADDVWYLPGAASVTCTGVPSAH